VEQVRQQVNSTFAVEVDLGLNTPAILDSIIDTMWNTGWSPSETAIDLFARDFGVLLIAFLNTALGGEIVSRGENSVLHLSVWWEEAGFEAFPVHFVTKRLSNPESDSIEFFVEMVRGAVSP